MFLSIRHTKRIPLLEEQKENQHLMAIFCLVIVIVPFIILILSLDLLVLDMF